jgi:hypothetical protein
MRKETVKGKKKKGAGESATPSGSDRTESVPVVSAAERPQPPANELSSLRDETEPKRRSHSEALRDYWRDVKAGVRSRRGVAREVPKDPERNPLLELPDKQRARIYAWMRDCPYIDSAQDLVEKEGIHGVTVAQIVEFHEEESKYQQDVRFARAAEEANALVAKAEKSGANFSGAILARLGQEVFRLISSGNLEPSAISRLGTLFLRARGDDRAALMHGLKREKLQRELQGQLDQAFEKLSEVVTRNPEAQEAFDVVRRELNQRTEEEA